MTSSVSHALSVRAGGEERSKRCLPSPLGWHTDWFSPVTRTGCTYLERGDLSCGQSQGSTGVACNEARSGALLLLLSKLADLP